MSEGNGFTYDTGGGRKLHVTHVGLGNGSPSGECGGRNVEYHFPKTPEPTYPRPIPVSERLPEENEIVLAWGAFEPNQMMAVAGFPWRVPEPEWHWARRANGEHQFETAMGYESESLVGVTHWLPLPPRPTEKQ